MKSMIVTGAGSGLGKEISLLLAKKSFHLILTGRKSVKLMAVKKEIEASGGNADILELDVSNEDNATRQINILCKQFDVYGLVNNAGVGHFGPIVELNSMEIKEMIETNVLGTIYLTRALLPHLNKGHIINIISTAGLRGKVNESVYAASKFAVRGFTESLQKEYQDSGIKFTAVYMGGMDTPFWENTDHIKDPSRLRPACEIAEEIINKMDEDSIIIESKKS